MSTLKKQLVCRVSDETYDAVMGLIDAGKYHSVSEYLYSLVLNDLGSRRGGELDIKPYLVEFLNTADGRDYLSKIMAEMLRKCTEESKYD